METGNTNSLQGLRQPKRALGTIRVINVNPVIKLSFDGILLFANNTGIDFLDMLSDYLKTPAVNYLLHECPEILNPHCNLDISCRLYDMNYYFSVVAFKEAGYVGLYGYRTVHTNTSGSLVA